MSEVLPQPGREEIDLGQVLAALADRGRLSTVCVIQQFGELFCGQLPDNAGLNFGKSTLSHHLRVLREAGITSTRVAGSRRYVSLRRDDLEARFPGLLDAVIAAANEPAVATP